MLLIIVTPRVREHISRHVLICTIVTFIILACCVDAVQNDPKDKDAIQSNVSICIEAQRQLASSVPNRLLPPDLTNCP